MDGDYDYHGAIRARSKLIQAGLERTEVEQAVDPVVPSILLID